MPRAGCRTMYVIASEEPKCLSLKVPSYLAHDLLQHVIAELRALGLQVLDDIPVSLRDEVVRVLVAAA